MFKTSIMIFHTFFYIFSVVNLHVKIIIVISDISTYMIFYKMHYYIVIQLRKLVFILHISIIYQYKISLLTRT